MPPFVRLLTLGSLVGCVADDGFDTRTCSPPTEYRIDSVRVPRNNAEAHSLGLDLNGDKVVDNTLGLVAGTIVTLFPEGSLDLAARAEAHLATDTDWRLAISECPDDHRLVALTDGPATIDGQLLGTSASGQIRASGRAAAVPLTSLWDGDGSAGPQWLSSTAGVIELPDPRGAETFTARLAVAIEGVAGAHAVVHAMTPFVDANLEDYRDDIDTNHDGTISEAELEASSLVQSLLAPDLTFDGVDSVSYGFEIHATRVP
jgi:hypothetical protein